jgi:UPF0176 protein
MNIVIAAFYKFVKLNHYKSLKPPLLSLMQTQGIKGTCILAEEGINGTVAGSREAIDALYAWFGEQALLADILSKESFHHSLPFNRTKVKIKKEIVTLGKSSDPTKKVGVYVKPQDWNAVISQEDVLVVDTRNIAEVAVGRFQGAEDPNTQSFRDFPQYVKTHLDPQKHKKVAMYCTGGIRCEKSTAYLLDQGFEEVYHLEGGILKYLETVSEDHSLWEGECFVFDERVTLNHALEKGSYSLCHGCRTPIHEVDKNHVHYIAGVSCPNCVHTHTENQKAGFLEREKQIGLAKARGESHIGGDVAHIIAQRRLDKKQKGEIAPS